MTRGKRRVRRPPDLTSLFDVLFIVVFVALIRAAAAQQAVAALTPPPKPAVPEPLKPPPPPADVAALRTKALSKLEADLAGRTPVVVRISTQLVGDRMKGTVEALEVGGRKLPLDIPLLADSRDPAIEVVYQGARSAELRVCRIVAVHLGVADLSRHLVIVAPDRPLTELERIAGSDALLNGLADDITRCFTDQRGIVTLVDPAEPKSP